MPPHQASLAPRVREDTANERKARASATAACTSPPQESPDLRATDQTDPHGANPLSEPTRIPSMLWKSSAPCGRGGGGGGTDNLNPNLHGDDHCADKHDPAIASRRQAARSGRHGDDKPGWLPMPLLDPCAHHCRPSSMTHRTHGKEATTCRRPV
jgi:hypothetical protein